MKKYYHFFTFILLICIENKSIGQTVLFNYTGSVQSYTVPSGVRYLSVDVVGACGGTGLPYGGRGGSGGRVQCTLAVSPNQVLYLYVGGAGLNAVGHCCVPIAGGYNGGGNCDGYFYSSSGGGATSISTSPSISSYSDRVVVAGGGGGNGCYGCYSEDGGDGGGITGGDGRYCGGFYQFYCGRGGTQTAGGLGATCGGGSGTNFQGFILYGHEGLHYGGGGGGGYYGGGGGCFYGGGGGGSSFPAYAGGYGTVGVAGTVTHTKGFNSASGSTSGNGYVTIFPINAIYAKSNTTITSLCEGPEIISTPSVFAPGMYVKTDFGDGVIDSIPMINLHSKGYANVVHTYTSSGTYNIRQILYVGILPLDTLTVSYNYNFCRSFPIRFYYDNNSNFLKDSWEQFSSRPTLGEVRANGIVVDTFTATSGMDYSVYGGLPGDIYSFRIISPPFGLTLTTPGSGIIVDTVTSSARPCMTKYVGLAIDPTIYNDFSIEGYSPRTLRDMQFGNISVRNNSPFLLSGDLTLKYSPKFLYTYNVTPAPTSTTATSITWHITNISASDIKPFTVYYEVNNGGGANLIPIRDTVHSSVEVNPSVGNDPNPSNNIRYRVDEVRGSLDPNELDVTPAGCLASGLASNELQYTVMFENCGNDTAFDIYVMDTLSDYLDPSSIKILNSSAEMYISKLKYGLHNIIRFDFPNINLLDSTHHADCSGSVSYTIRSRPSLPDGTVISNYAGIFFDNNGVVMTNVAQNTIGCPIAPGVISGYSVACTGGTTTLSNPVPGGAWSSGNTTVAIVGSGSGVITGMAAGIADITYTILSSGLRAISAIIVKQSPTSISGQASVCAGFSTTLSNGATGGAWSSTNTTLATVSNSGIATALSQGLPVIKYTSPNGCFTQFTLTVNPQPASITGSPSVCVGATSTLANTVTGGNWTSSSPVIASVTAAGVVSGIAGGNVIISYTLPSGCETITSVSVNPVPTPILGITKLCAGASVTLSNAISGGAWIDGTPAVATIGSSGLVSGLLAGTCNVSYVLPTGCYSFSTLTVNPVPGHISGSTNVCTGSTISLSDPATGGWISGNPGIASIGSLSGIVTGITQGTAIITFANLSGCSITTTITVNEQPAAITGPTVLCTGVSSSLSNATMGGTWSSANTNVATIGNGILRGQTTGATTITYTLATGCYSTFAATVSPSPAAISGLATLCKGASRLLSNSVSGGIWTSGNTAIAGISAGSGVLSGLSTGVSGITYTLPNGCYASTTVFIAPLPAGISGANIICSGGTTSLTNSGSGTWTSSNGSVATIGLATGIAIGFTAGSSRITFTDNAGCIVTTMLTVNNLPQAITGATSLCESTVTTLHNPATGGTWTTGDPAIAKIDAHAGILSAMSAGTVNISYTITHGCSTYSTVIVNAQPSAISGRGTACVGATTTLFNSSTGSWSSNSSNLLAINANTGIVTGKSPGIATVSFTNSSGCWQTAVMTINPSPGAITGINLVCEGASTNLSNSVAGGDWVSSQPAQATVDLHTGKISGNSAGTAVITYTLPAGCSATQVVSVNPSPAMITGPAGVCKGATISLTDFTAGGTWSSGDVHIANIGIFTGQLAGIKQGTVVIAYSSPNGCRTTTTIEVLPVPSTASGPTEVCEGTIISLHNSGGVWTSANTNIKIDSFTGLVTGLSAGSALVSYVLPSSCLNTTHITVNPQPLQITGTGIVCEGGSANLFDATAGGIWIAADATVVHVHKTTGAITGITSGTAMISYTLPTGCSSITVVTVNPTPAAISGLPRICVGESATLTSATTGGTWSSGDTAIVFINATNGTLSGISAGGARITYSLNTGCASTTSIYVHAMPPGIRGARNICVGYPERLLNDMPGGTWRSSDLSLAIVDSVFGLVRGVSDGNVIITYLMPTGCYVTYNATISPIPFTVTGQDHVCEGHTISLANISSGGIWNASDVALASVDAATGEVRGVSAGAPMISYVLPTGCFAFKSITVDPVPGPLSGETTLCVGATTVLHARTTGGTWKSDNITIATTDAMSGVIFGQSAGTTNVINTLTTGCFSAAAITVMPLPGTPTIYASGTVSVCVGTTDTFTALPTGGTWTGQSGKCVVADGIVTGAAEGRDVINYSLANSCGIAVATYPVSVFPASYCDSVLGGHMFAVGRTGYIDVFPNPNNGEFKVMVGAGSDEPVSVTISNMLGQKVALFNAVTNTPAGIKLSLHRGIYIISSMGSNGTYFRKFTIE